MTTTYQVVTHGLSGELTKAVASQRLRQLNISEQVVEKLVDHSIVLKKELPLAQAEAYESKLTHAGLSVELRPEGVEPDTRSIKGAADQLKSSFASKASSLTSFGEKLKQGVGSKLKSVNVPIGQTRNDDMLISDDEDDNDYRAKQAEKRRMMDQSAKTSGRWRGPHDVDKLFHSEMPRVKMPASLPIHASKGLFLTLLMPGLYGIITLMTVWFILSNIWSAFASLPSIMSFISLFFLVNSILLIFLFFLIKPIIAFRPQSPVVEATRHECPELFWLVEAVCNKLKVDPPEAISLDMGLDMRIKYVDGFKGFMANRTHLVIGAPLTQSLSTAEFVGILAHTLGHLRQPFGGRSYAVIRIVNYFLYLSSRENDRLDDWIERELEKNEIAAIVDLLLTAGQRIFATNKVILGFMLRNHVKLMGKNARALDMHADQFAAVIIGSDMFEQLAIEYRKAIRAFEQSEGVNDQLMAKNQLLQDIPEVVGSLARGYDSRIENLLQQDVEHRLTYTWEPHPADWERIDKANFLQASAIMFCDEALVELIPSLHQLGVRATRAFYEHQGLDVSEYKLARPKL